MLTNSSQVNAPLYGHQTKETDILKEITNFRKKHPWKPQKTFPLFENSLGFILHKSKITLDELGFLKTFQPNKKIKLSVGSQVRAKMVDWFLEIAYKCNLRDRTCYLAIFYLDSYLNHSPCSLEKFHLMGIAIIFCAMKYEEIYPMQIEDIQEQIGHSMYTTLQIMKAEAQFLRAIQFRLCTLTIEDSINFIMDLCQFRKDLKVKKNVIKICQYYSKALIIFQNSLQIELFITGMSIVYLSMKSMQKLVKQMKAESILRQLCANLGLEEELVKVRSKQIIEKVKRLKIEFEGLKNLERFNKIEH